jgi:fructose/tagatose bisphosphate aldolase
LKIAYMEANRAYLTADPAAADPPALFAHVHKAVMAMTREHIHHFGAEGRA